MKTSLAILAVALFAAAPVYADGLSGQYVEARTCDVWTGACFANAEMNLTGKHAVLAWKFDQGRIDGVSIDGLSVVAVVEATDTLGLKQTGASKAIMVVDAKASPAQRDALVAAARKLGGELLANVIAVEAKPIEVATDCCKEKGCAKVVAGLARIETRCLHADHDKVCGNEGEYYPPLTRGVKAIAAMCTDHSYTGKAFNATWKENQRRGAYVGSFSVSAE